jgi:hypothetical protein
MNSDARLKEVRAWLKSLPTFAVNLTDVQSQILDTAVVQEIDRKVKSFYAVC